VIARTGELEAGAVSQSEGALRFSLNVVRGRDFDGGHAEDKGLSPMGTVVDVPEHRHVVSLDFVRFELVADYAFADSWNAWLRIPYDVKDRTAKIELVDPATPDEVAAMESNLAIHHPSETLEGFSDLHLLAARKRRDLFLADDLAIVALGSSLPVGRTESDPYAAGDAGEPHEHVQFGSGTFDPLLELYYGAPLATDLRLSLFTVGRFPLYENRKEYRGPTEVSSGFHLSRRLSAQAAVHGGWTSLYQGYAKWDGERDVNTGLVAHEVSLGAKVDLGRGTSVSLDLRLPVSQRTLSDSGDAFEQGSVLQLGVSTSF